MNILIVNHYAGSTAHGMEYRPYYFAQEWVKAGHIVTIIAASFSHLRYLQPKCQEPISIEFINNIKYVWIKTRQYQGNGFPRVLNMLSFSWKVWNKILPIGAPDIVIDSSTYPLTIYGSAKIANKYGAKLIFEVHDLWPLTPMELGGFSKGHPFIMVLQWAEDYAYKKADRVVSLLPKAREYMVAHGMSANKFVHIPNGANFSNFDVRDSLPREHSALITKLKRQGKFIIGYLGGHNISNALKYLLAAAEMVKKQDEIHFILVGQGSEKQALQDLARKLNLCNISFLSPISKTTVPMFLEAMDAVYIGWLRSPLYRYGVTPNKLIDYMMAAKPVIYSIDAANNLVAESGCGVSVPPEDPQAIADALYYMLKISPEEREAMGRNGYNYVKAHYDYGLLSKKYLKNF